MGNQYYLTAHEVGEIMCCSVSHGSKIIKNLNDELIKKGFIVIAGKVPRKYFFERTGLDDAR